MLIRRDRPSLQLLLLLSFFLIWGGENTVWAQQTSQSTQADQPTQEEKSEQQASDHLVVPIFPRLKNEDAIKSVEDLKDAYVVLEDGAVISVADWILGSLDKSKVGAGMSDYENRLFLGQVARAVAGLDQDLVYRSFEDAGPPAPFVPHNPPVPLQVAQGLLSMVIPGLGPGWKPTIPDPKLTSITDRRSGGTGQFHEQFHEALQQSNGEFLNNGTMRTMLKDAEDN